MRASADDALGGMSRRVSLSGIAAGVLGIERVAVGGAAGGSSSLPRDSRSLERKEGSESSRRSEGPERLMRLREAW